MSVNDELERAREELKTREEITRSGNLLSAERVANLKCAQALARLVAALDAEKTATGVYVSSLLHEIRDVLKRAPDQWHHVSFYCRVSQGWLDMDDVKVREVKDAEDDND